MILRLFMCFYRLLWLVAVPLVLVYLGLRGRRDKRYLAHLRERFGFYRQPLPQAALWVHAVSLGEVRSAIGLIRLMLARGDQVVITNFTPAGRQEAERQFAKEIAAGQVAVIWSPLDMFWCLRRFFRACQPRFGLTLEVEIWPAMIASARKHAVPLYLCNAQYGSAPMARDSRGLRLRQRVIASCAGALVKSDLQAARFASVGVRNIHVTGELRFDQPIPRVLLEAAALVRPVLVGDPAKPRSIVTIASGVAGEEEIYTQLIHRLHKRAVMAGQPVPLVIYVPRAPELFGAVGAGLEAAGFRVARRSALAQAGGDALSSMTQTWDAQADVLVGDSMGEMYFYLSVADQVIVGGGFTEAGAHNIIEPLSVGKPPVTGPYTWPIEFPFAEADAAGVAQSFATWEEMAEALATGQVADADQVADFMRTHRGASARTLAAVDSCLAHPDS